MEKKHLPLCVIIPTMNRPNALYDTLKTMLLNQCIPAQIIIVDQSNVEDYRIENEAVINELRLITNITYLYQEIPCLTKARNYGLMYSEYDIVICSDDDVLVKEDTLMNIYNIMQDGSVAMIGGLDTNMGKSNSRLAYLFGTKSRKKKNIGHVTKSIHGRYPNYVIGEVETEWAMGYFFVIRKSLVQRYNLKWDENLISYGYAEDLDFSYSYYKMVSKDQLRCILTDKVIVTHLATKEWRIPSYHNTLMYIMNREYLSNKHFNKFRYKLIMRWANIGEFLNRLTHNRKPFHIIKAQRFCDKYHKEIKEGNLDTIFGKIM